MASSIFIYYLIMNFYLKRGYELFDERVFEYNGHKMGSWSLKKVL